jgi:hypothetical protein
MLLTAALLLAVCALLQAISLPECDLRLCRLWKLAGHEQTLSPARWWGSRVTSALALLLLTGLALSLPPLPVLRWYIRAAAASLAGGMGWCLPWLILQWRWRQRARQVALELPALVDRLSVALGCGLGWNAALQLAAETRVGADICRLLDRRAQLVPAPMAQLARRLRHQADALACLQQWSREQGRAAYHLPHDAYSWTRRPSAPLVAPRRGAGMRRAGSLRR